jgi:hypothetical protein
MAWKKWYLLVWSQDHTQEYLSQGNSISSDLYFLSFLKYIENSESHILYIYALK